MFYELLKCYKNNKKDEKLLKEADEIINGKLFYTINERCGVTEIRINKQKEILKTINKESFYYPYLKYFADF
jgi:hypothetical protein